MTSALQNPLRSLYGYQLRRASAATMDQLSRSLAEIGLRPIEASILVVVAANPMVKLSEVGRELGVQRANMTPLVGALERQGLIEREAVDGRSQGLRLTIKGSEACASALAAMQFNDERLLQHIEGATRNDLCAALSAVWSGSSGR